LPETRRLAREMVDNIAGSGVRVIGDLESLALVPEAPTGDSPTADVPGPPQIAAGMAMGVLLATGEARHDSDITVETRDRELERVPLFVLGTAIAIRARDAARRRVRSLRRLGRVS
jgi:hypothetical protein